MSPGYEIDIPNRADGPANQSGEPTEKQVFGTAEQRSVHYYTRLQLCCLVFSPVLPCFVQVSILSVAATSDYIGRRSNNLPPEHAELVFDCDLTGTQVPIISLVIAIAYALIWLVLPNNILLRNGLVRPIFLNMGGWLE